MAADLAILSFNGGELSPHLDGRSDLEKYYSGCRLLVNMIPLPYGDAERRPGTYFVCELKDNSKKARLIPFQFSTEQAYILEFGDQYMRFYKDRGQIKYTDISFGADPSGDFAVGATMTGASSEATAIVVAKVSTQVYTIKYEQGTWTDGEIINCGDKNVNCAANYPTTTVSDTAVEVSSDYLEADLFGIQNVQSADVLYGTHSSYPPAKLLRYSHDHWLLEDIVFDWPPFLEENTEDTTITPPHIDTSTDLTGSLTYAASTTSGSFTASKAFNDILSFDNGWRSTSAVNQWVRVDFGTGTEKTIKKLRIQNCAAGFFTARQIRHCKLEGSDNASDWTKISVNTWIEHCSQYNTDEIEVEKMTNLNIWAEVLLTNPTAYRYYRLYIYDNWGEAGYMQLQEVEMMEIDESNEYVATDPIFTSNHVGSYWLIKHPRTDEDGTDANSQSGTIAASDTDGTTLTKVEGVWSVKILGDYNGRFVIERSYDNSNWHTLETFNPTGSQPYNISGEEEGTDAYYRVATRTRTAGTLRYTISVERYYHFGIIKVIGFTDTTHVTGVAIKELGGTAATKLWSEGAWSDKRGYPVSPAFYEGRLWFAGTTYRPLDLWGSRVNDYENMRTGTLDDDALKYTIDSSMQNMIRWLVGQDVLLVGTSGAEWKLGSVDPSDAITPTNPIKPRIQTTYGSSKIQAILLANVILFVGAQGRKVRGAQYIFEKGEFGGYNAPDYTMFAEHITESGIVGMAYQQNPSPILWCWREDGTLIGMVFEPGQNVWGWFRCPIDGLVESVAVINGVDEDEVWLIVKRTIGGNTKRYIEYFKPRDWGSDQADCFFVDSGLSFNGGDAVDISRITKANPCVVTVDTWPTNGDGDDIADGDQIKILSVEGMTEVNNKVYTVSNPNVGAKTFELRDKLDEVDIDSTGFTTYTSGGTVRKVENAFSGLDHLEGETVSVLGDGAVHADVTVSSGSVTLTDYYNKVHIGLPFTSKLKPMKLEIPGGGTIRARKKRIHEIIFSFYKTLGAKFGTTKGSETIPFRKTTDPMGSPPPLFTGEKAQSFPGGYELSGDIYIEQNQPLPMTVRSIIARLELYG